MLRKILPYIDSWLDTLTMYRLLIYYLIALLAAAAGLSLAGDIHYNPLVIVLSPLMLTAVCWVSNKVFATVYEAPSNVESVYITALILALIVPPPVTLYGWLFVVAAGGLAMASKYMLAIGKQHIFNPAAIAVVLTTIAGQAPSWWVGSAPLLPFVLVGGLLLARKIRRMQMVLIFLTVAFAATAVDTWLTHGQAGGTLQKTALNSAIFFLAFVMLTEPASSPTTLTKQRWYGAFAGLLFPPQLHVAGVYSTPELVLVASNVFSYIINPKVRLFPLLAARQQLAPGIVDFRFTARKKPRYQPGQYMEWTLPHHADARGQRRYFTLASSPTEPDLRLGVKFYANGSTYKKTMLAMDEHTSIVASQVAGDFVLPADKARKLAFIAGGVGVTPYRSMLKYLVDRNERRDITMLYSAATAKELVYTDVFEDARSRLGTNILYVTSENTTDQHYRTGRITQELIKQEIPDYAERQFYISGSHAMVAATQDILHQLGISRQHIKTDFFPGLK